MNKIFALIAVMILLAGCTRPAVVDDSLAPDRTVDVTPPDTRLASPESRLRSMLPDSWNITVEESSVPALWTGDAACRLIKLNNPSEVYYSEFGNFNYTAWYNFWFCPKDWAGTCDSAGCNPQSVVQEYPAALLCDCTNFKVFYNTIGENSQRDLPDRIKQEFS